MSRFLIYSKPDCPHCVRAKQLLKVKGIDYTEKSLATDEERFSLLSKLQGWRTFPAIFELHPETGQPFRFIGGADALEQVVAGA